MRLEWQAAYRPDATEFLPEAKRQDQPAHLPSGRGYDVTDSTAPPTDKTAPRLHEAPHSPENAEPTAGAWFVSRSVRDRLVRLAYRFLWNRDDAEDAVHDALLAGQRRKHGLRDEAKALEWMQRIVINQCHERGRGKLRWLRHEPELRAEAARRHTVDRADSTADLKEPLRRLLHELPRRQHEVMVLRHIQGMGYDEIGRVLRISQSTARVHARAGREALRILLLRRHPGWFDQARGTSDKRA